MTDTKYISDFDKTNLSLVYDKARNLSTETIDIWMKTLSARIESANVKRIIDLGCGTGRFTRSLVEYFHCNVTGIDPSNKMLSVAKESLFSENIRCIPGTADNMNIEDNSTDMIFLSQ